MGSCGLYVLEFQSDVCVGVAQYEGVHAFLFEALGVYSSCGSAYFPDVGARGVHLFDFCRGSYPTCW